MDQKQIILRYHGVTGKTIKKVVDLMTLLKVSPLFPRDGEGLQHLYLYGLSYTGSEIDAVKALLHCFKTSPLFSSKWIIGGEVAGSLIADSFQREATAVLENEIFAVSWERSVKVASFHLEVATL